MIEKFTFFWHGVFSNWYGVSFKIDGIIYNCTEQFMMAEKARLFCDEVTYKLIMNTTNPKIQKALGRKVKGFKDKVWNRVAKDIVYKGNLEKFKQNETLKILLIATNGTTLVEASPYDKIWGIGLNENDPNSQSRDTWKGTNWLGEVLTQVRKDII